MNALRFHQPEGVYLLSHSVGLLPQGVEEQVHHRLFEPWKVADNSLWDGWLKEIGRFRAAIAAVLCGKSGERQYQCQHYGITAIGL